MADAPLLVTPEELAGCEPGETVLADVRWYLDGRSGRQAYEAGHLPGAVFVDLATDLSTPGRPDEGRHPLPSPEHFCAAMTRVGIGAMSRVVAYDDSGGGTAGRLVWMLRAQGLGAALLDGGLLQEANGPLETGPGGQVAPANPPLSPRPWPAELLATFDDVTEPGPASLVLDARSAERYRGESETVDPRAGHIPRAVSTPWTAALDPVTGRFRSPDDLRSWLTGLGIRPGRVIASCGSGVSACALLIAVERAGLGPGRLFVPSWSGWSADPTRPVATGPNP
jgi:thiosulfate/3-mercaptopyruvate sulfurtransferase